MGYRLQKTHESSGRYDASAALLLFRHSLAGLLLF
jgi:hypothetical protein